jgi:hypothetical protein
MMTAVEPQRSSRVSSRTVTPLTQPVDRLAQRKTLVVGHRQQRLPGALSVPGDIGRFVDIRTEACFSSLRVEPAE